MNDRQFRWGLSGGVSVLAIAGFFWFGVSFGVITTKWGWGVWGFSTALQVGVSASLIAAAVRLRQRSGFAPGDVRRGDQLQRKVTQRVLRAFGWIVLLQAGLIALAVWWCVRTATNDMIWPSIGLIVSVHFAPLGRLFHVRTYYATGLAGSVISLSALTGLTVVHHLVWFGGAMAAVMWLSGWHIIRNADQITARAVQENWVL